MNSLSEIFNGKVPGMMNTVPVGADRVSVIEDKVFNPSKEREEKAEHLKEKARDVESKIFGSFGIGGGSGKVTYGLGGTNSGKVTFGLNAGGGGLLPSYKEKALSIEQKVFGNIKMNTEKIGWGRMKQQQGLSLFGDHDKDRALNIFDCDPRNPLRQARRHEMVGGPEAPTVTTRTGRKIEVYEPTEAPQEPRVSGTQQVRQRLGGFGRGFINVLTGVGLVKTPEQKQTAWEQKMREKELSIKERALMTKEEVAKQRAEIERAKALGMMAPKPKRGYPTRQVPYGWAGAHAGQTLRDIEGGTRAFARSTGAGEMLPGISGESQRISSLMGVARTGAGMYETTARRTSGTGIYEALGREPPMQAVQPIPQPRPQPTTGYDIPRQPRGAAPPGKVWSELSKRWVTYPRGRYDKRRY